MTVTAFIQKTLTPLIYISCISMFFFGGTLLWYGELAPVWPAVMGLLMSPVIFPIAMLPSAVFAGLSVIVQKRNPLFEKLLLFASGVYLIALMAAYAMVGFLYVVGLPWPIAIAYGVSAGVAPWAILASKDRGNVFFTGLVLMMALSGIVYGVINVQMAVRGTPVTEPLHKYAILFTSMLVLAGIQLLCEKLFPPRKDEKKPEEKKPEGQGPETTSS